MTPSQTLLAIATRELKKIDDLSSKDNGILSPGHLEALESLAKVMKQLGPVELDDAPSELSQGQLAALVAATFSPP